MNNLTEYLKGGDLRSTGNVDELIPLIKTRETFDELFSYLFSDDRLIVMRAADAVEKITLDKPDLLHPHKKELIDYLVTARDKELKWHLALMTPRLRLSDKDLNRVWSKLAQWAKDSSESKIVRVNSLQALSELAQDNDNLRKNFSIIAESVKKENIPSINARLRKLNV